MTERETSCTYNTDIVMMKEQIKTLFMLIDDFNEMVKNITILTENMNFIKGDVEEIKKNSTKSNKKRLTILITIKN